MVKIIQKKAINYLFFSTLFIISLFTTFFLVVEIKAQFSNSNEIISLTVGSSSQNSMEYYMERYLEDSVSYFLNSSNPRFIYSVGNSTCNKLINLTSLPSDTGKFAHIIKNPFGGTLVNNSVLYNAPYDSRQTRQATVENSIVKFSEFGNQYEYDYDLEGGSSWTEPFCRLGGHFQSIVYNNPHRVIVNNPTYADEHIFCSVSSIFYCKTTIDMLPLITIPLSWNQSNLSMYCNDGSEINFRYQNFDFLTSAVKDYKLCILKNLDLDDKNTIVYGLEVGNSILDDSDVYFFNKTSKTSEILKDLTYVNHIGTYSDEKIVLEDTIFLEYEDGDVANFSRSKELIEATGKYGEVINISYIFNHSSFRMSEVRFKYNYNRTIELYNFSNNNGRYFQFIYDSSLGFYSLSEVTESFEYNITQIFPLENFEDSLLTRVLFSKNFPENNEKNIYGYEKTNLRFFSDEKENLNPIYHIKFNNNLFNSQNCTQMLAAYEPQLSGLAVLDKLACIQGSDNTLIKINSDIMNNYIYHGAGFNLFRNIILGIDSENLIN